MASTFLVQYISIPTSKLHTLVWGLQRRNECIFNHSAAHPIPFLSISCLGFVQGRLDVYSYGSGTSTKTSTSASATATGSAGWNFRGCYTDSVSSRTLRYAELGSGGAAAMTIEQCQTACQGLGYTLAGVEYADECCRFFFHSFVFTILLTLFQAATTPSRMGVLLLLMETLSVI
jgi:hypothetical protein